MKSAIVMLSGGSVIQVSYFEIVETVFMSTHHRATLVPRTVDGRPFSESH